MAQIRHKTVYENAEQRLASYEALDTAHCSGDYYGPFVDLLNDSVEPSFQPYWWALGIEK